MMSNAQYRQIRTRYDIEKTFFINCQIFSAQPSLLLMIEEKEISKFDFDRLSYTVYASKLNFDNKDCRKCEENDKIYTESFSVSDSQLRSCQWTRY